MIEQLQVSYPETTVTELHRVASKPSESLTRQDRIMLMLQGGGWVDSLTLATRGGGLQYNARIHELRLKGVLIEQRRNPDSPKGEYWGQFRLGRV